MMASYLLLRDNKQNGPFSFEELKAKGLKAYDLVWVEGKSAAWRYPGEIEELKPFSPAVVEQPFDRFYKRNTSTEKREEPVRQKEVLTAKEEQPVYQQASLQTSKGSVYVTLPGEKQHVVRSAQIFSNAAKPVEAEIKKEEFSLPAIEQTRARSLPIIETAGLDREKRTPSPQKTVNPPWVVKSLLSAGFLKSLFIAASVLLLLGAGIFIGLSIRKPAAPQEVSASNPAPTSSQPANETVVLPVSTEVAKEKPTDNNLDESQTTAESQPVEKNTSATPEKKKITPGAKENAVVPLKAISLPQNRDTAQATVSNPTTRREAIHRTDQDLAPRETPKNNLVNLVTISANKYNVGTFGGISDLQLTVSNRSVHALDLVIVEISYLQANKKTFKTESVYFRNIGAGQSLMQEAPKSPRGIRIQTRITVINAAEPGLSYSGL